MCRRALGMPDASTHEATRLQNRTKSIQLIIIMFVIAIISTSSTIYFNSAGKEATARLTKLMTDQLQSLDGHSALIVLSSLPVPFPPSIMQRAYTKLSRASGRGAFDRRRSSFKSKTGAKVAS